MDAQAKRDEVCLVITVGTAPTSKHAVSSEHF